MAFALNTDYTLGLWALTLAAYPRKDMDMDYLFPQHQFLAVDRMWGKEKKKVGPGTAYKDQINTAENGQTQFINPGAVRTGEIADAFVELMVPYSNVVVPFYMVDAEIRRNKGMAKLHSLAQGRRQSADMDMAMTLDKAFFAQLPQVNNNVYPNSLPYYFVPITTTQMATSTATGAHQGGNPTGFSNCAGIDASTTSRWQSYNAAWTNDSATITEEDLRRMGQMARHLHFKAPLIATPDVVSAQMKRLGVFTCEAIIDGYTAALRRNKDTIQADDPSQYYGAGLGAAGEPMFHGIPLAWAEPLDMVSETIAGDYPLYLTNFEYFHAAIEEDCDFREDPPMRVSSAQPDVFVTWTQLSGNIVCRNRQFGGGCISYKRT